MVVHVMPCVKMYFLGIIHQFKFAGRDAIMPLAELVIHHSDKRLKTCAKDIQQKPCGQKKESWVNHNAKNIDNIEDLRIHADMFPENPRNIYRACLAGVRR